MRPSEGEVLIDLVGEQPQIALPAQLGDAGDLLGGEHGPGRIVRAVDPNEAGARRHRAGEAVEVRMKTPLGPERHIHHMGAARPNYPLIGSIDRLGQNHLVAGSRETVQRAEEAALGPRCQDDVLGAARAAGAPLEPRGDGRAHLRVADDRRVPGAVSPQRLDGRADDRLGGSLVGIADGQKDHVVSGVAAAYALLVNAPSFGSLARDPVDKRRETHNDLLVSGIRPGVTTRCGRRASFARMPILCVGIA